MITAFHHPGFAAPIGDHVMPMWKFQRVADGLAGRPDVRVEAPAPIDPELLRSVHTADYVNAVRTGEPRALDAGLAAALASGFHHAHADHGEGFCTFNGLVVAAELVRAAGRVRHVAVLDLATFEAAASVHG